MDRNTNCTHFEALLNDYLDNELDAGARAEFLAHAKDCPGCSQKLNDMQKLLTMCAELDEGLVIPLDAQSAWRKAIREEAQKTKRAGTWSLVRAVSGIAAAVVVLVGGTLALRSTGLLSLSTLQPNEVIVETIERNFPNRRPEPTGAPYDLGGVSSRASTASPVYESDGPYMDDMSLDAYEEAETGADLSAREDKVIRTASRDMETASYDADLAGIKDLVAEYDGKIESFSEYGQPLEQGNQYGRTAYLSVRVPTDMRDEFFAALDFGTTVSQSTNDQDISYSYYDTEGRLNAKKAVRDKLTQMIASAESFTDLLEAERQIAEVQAEIDAMEGTIRNWDYQVQSAQISISLREVAERNTVASIASKTFGERITTGFYDSINLFLSFMQDALVLLVLIAPELVLAAIVAIIVVASVRRHRRRKRAA